MRNATPFHQRVSRRAADIKRLISGAACRADTYRREAGVLEGPAGLLGVAGGGQQGGHAVTHRADGLCGQRRKGVQRTPGGWIQMAMEAARESDVPVSCPQVSHEASYDVGIATDRLSSSPLRLTTTLFSIHVTVTESSLAL